MQQIDETRSGGWYWDLETRSGDAIGSHKLGIGSQSEGKGRTWTDKNDVRSLGSRLFLQEPKSIENYQELTP